MPKIKEKVSFKDDTYMQLDNEFDQIRECIGMYISKGETDGAMHMFKEGINNGIDEFVNPNSPMTRMDIIFDEGEQSFFILDDGRGIPLSELLDAVTKKHVSTKFLYSAVRGKSTAGLNGVGLKVMCALSDYFSITSYRESQSGQIEMINDELKVGKTKALKKEQHGLAVKILPSEKYLGPINLTMDLVTEYMRKMSYVFPDGLKVGFLGNPRDKNLKSVKRDYSHTDGLISNIKFLSSSLEFNPISISISTEPFDIDVVFSYDKTLDDSLCNSYGNMIVTTEGGYHETAAMRAICEYFCRAAKEIDPTNKFEVIFDDCKKGLIYCVNCRHVKPAFEGQHKSRVSNKDVLDEGKRLLVGALRKKFQDDQATLRKIITYLRQISKIRLESNKIKGISAKKTSTFLDDAEIKGFYNISTRNYNDYCEIIVTEGDSAGGAIDSIRNRRFQAVYELFGVIDNIYGLDERAVLMKEVLKNFVAVLGCGIGKTYNRNALRWNKIIIMTDADVDGTHITTLLLNFLYQFYPDLFKEGIIYKAIPPLYILNKNQLRKFYRGDEWLFDKHEYYKIMNIVVSQNMTICIGAFQKGSEMKRRADVFEIPYHDLSKSELTDWLEMNDEYMLELEALIKRTQCQPIILEYVCFYKLLTDNEHDLKRLIEKKFPEIEYNIMDHSLYGSYRRENVSLICDTLFDRISQKFKRALDKNVDVEIEYCNKHEGDGILTKSTIGEFLSVVDRRYAVPIEQRMKGLGEAPPELLFSTVINPKMRHLIRLYIKDHKKTADMFEILQSKTADMRQARRQLLKDNPLSYADIDN